MAEALTESSEDNLPSTKPLAILVVGLSVLPLGLFVFSLLGRYFFLAELVGNFRAQILVMLIPFPIVLWMLGRWKWGSVLAIATVGAMIGVVSTFLPGYQPAAGPKTLRLMSFNVFDQNQDADSVALRVRVEDPDVLTILEFSNHWAGIFEQFHDRYPYRVLEPRWHGFGIAVFSKYPLEETEVYALTKKTTDNPCIATTIKFGNQTLRIVGIHVLSPTNIFRLRLRNKQLDELAQIMDRSDVPTIVMGDFNCTPWSPYLRDFLNKTGYRDSRQGFGYQPSWYAYSWLLLIPIDHAFVSNQVHIHDRYICKAAGSDHLPLVVEASVTEGQKP